MFSLASQSASFVGRSNSKAARGRGGDGDYDDPKKLKEELFKLRKVNLDLAK